MPLTHTRAFRVRFDECDAYGHVNNAVYLRYMQETAFDASAAAGFGAARYTAMGRLWLTHDTQIDYLRPLAYGDTVAVTTWVADFARVRSRRMYELRQAGSGELVAQAHTDWVFLDAASRRPAPIPADLIRAFFLDEPAPQLKREPFPAAPPPPPGPFSVRRRVEWRDVDTAGIVNNPNYLAYVAEAGFAVSEAHGWPHQRMEAAGFGILARRHRLEHRRPAGYGDELLITTWASAMRAASGVRHYQITRAADGELVTRVHSQYVWVDRRTLKPIRIPADFLADFAPNIAGAGPTVPS
ncbi:MAG: acyl-CoA thioesterase [Anaerolineales bacterium]|nr:acyl-CoA thioesterase [Anaerolineales bacterium]